MTRRALIAATTFLAVLLIAAPARADWVWPVSGEVITPYRNGDDPYASGQHRGIDIAADLGAPVVSATGGDVRFAGTAGSSGLTVSIRTADGLFDTSYLHLSSLDVGEGERVAAGALIGTVGTTGVRSAEGPHLHFGVRDAGSRHAYHDPLAFLPPAGLTPERPRATPAPAPVPLAPEPGRAPAARPAPTAHREPLRVPLPRGTPVPRHLPLPHVAPRRVPADRRAARPGPEAAPLVVPVPRGAPVTAGDTARAPHAPGAPSAHGAPHAHTRAAGGDESARRPAGRPDALQRRPQAAAHGPTSQSGPDLGWALACLGLLFAAGILALSEHGRGMGRRGRGASRCGRDRLAVALRPLLGRR